MTASTPPRPVRSCKAAVGVNSTSTFTWRAVSRIRAAKIKSSTTAMTGKSHLVPVSSDTPSARSGKLILSDYLTYASRVRHGPSFARKIAAGPAPRPDVATLIPLQSQADKRGPGMTADTPPTRRIHDDGDRPLSLAAVPQHRIIRCLVTRLCRSSAQWYSVGFLLRFAQHGAGPHRSGARSLPCKGAPKTGRSQTATARRPVLNCAKRDSESLGGAAR